MKRYLCLIVFICSVLVFNVVAVAEEIYSLDAIDNMEFKSINIESVDNNLEEIARRIINYAAPNMYPDNDPQLTGVIKRYQSVSSEDSFLEINKDVNTILFNKGFDYSKEESTYGLPAEKAAVTVAEKHLKNLDLLPDESELVLLHVGGVNMDVYDSQTGETASYKKLVTVRYGREISGLSVVGPGSRIIVQLGTSGQLNGLVYNWADYSSENISIEGSVRSMDSLDQQITSKLDSAGENGTYGSVKKELVMYDDGNGHIEPAIYVKADLVFGSGEKTVKSQYDFYVPLLKAPKAEFPNITGALIPPMKDSIN